MMSSDLFLRHLRCTRPRPVVDVGQAGLSSSSHSSGGAEQEKDSIELVLAEAREYLPGHGTILWAGSVVMAQHMFSSWRAEFCPPQLQKPILDLGSGLGLTAMMAASLILDYNSGCDRDEARHDCLSPPVRVVASDLPANLPHLRRVLELNGCQSWLASSSSSSWSPSAAVEGVRLCEAVALDWFHPEAAGLEPQSFGAVVGCEVVYHEPLVEPLVRTIDYLLAPGGTAYLVSARHRHCFLHFFHRLLQLGYSLATESLPVPFIPATPCFVDDKAAATLQEYYLKQVTSNETRSEAAPSPSSAVAHLSIEAIQQQIRATVGMVELTPSEELSVGWFSEGEFLHDLNKLILVRATKPKAAGA